MKEKKYTNELIMAFIGEPSSPDSPATRTGYGYSALLCTDDATLHEIFKAVSMWNGHTKVYSKGQDVYRFYELDCRDRSFFESKPFERICRAFDLDVHIYTESHDLYTNFYRDAHLLV